MLDVSQIKKLLDEDKFSFKKKRAKEGLRYYDGDHDIKDYKIFYFNDDGQLVEDRARANQRISHPFFTEIADQFIAYMLSNTDEIITAKVDGLQEHLDPYFDGEFWAEFSDVLTGSYVKGFEYMYAFQNADDRRQFHCADSLGVVEVRENETDDKCACYIWAYVDRYEDSKAIIKIQVHTATEIYYYEQDTDTGDILLDKDQKINPRPYIVYDEGGTLYYDDLGCVPFFRLDYNKRQISGLKPIKHIIDDYDLMNCGLSNNLQDFDTPIFAVKGFEGDSLDKIKVNVASKKIIGVDADGDIDVKTVDVPYQARQAKMDEDKTNIYHFGMGLNTENLKDAGATTNLAIQSAYSWLDLKTTKFKPRVIKFLKTLVKVVLDEINAKNGTAYTIDNVDIDIKPQTLINEQESIQNEKTKAETQQIKINNILSTAAYFGDDETLKGLCDVYELDYEEIKASVEKAKEEEVPVDDAANVLNNIITEDAPTGTEDGEEGVEE